MQGVEERERKKIPAKGEGGRCEVEEEQVCGRETCIYGCVCVLGRCMRGIQQGGGGVRCNRGIGMCKKTRLSTRKEQV